MKKLIILLYIFAVFSVLGHGEHKFKLNIDKGMFFDENTKRIEYINAAPVTKEIDFELDAGYGISFQYLKRIFDYDLGDKYRDDFDLSYLLDLSFISSSDSNVFTIQGGSSFDISWLQFQFMLGMTKFSSKVENLGYIPENEKYSWYNESKTIDLSGFTFTMAILIDIPLVETDLGQWGIVGGINYMQVFGEDYSDRFSIKLGFSLIL